MAQHVGQGLVSMIHFDTHADTGHIKFGWLEVLSGRLVRKPELAGLTSCHHLGLFRKQEISVMANSP